MAKDSVLYFKHDANASEDRKCKALRRIYGWEGQGWYWKIIESLRDEENYKLPYDDITFDSFVGDFNIDIKKAREFIDDCIDRTHLLTKQDGFFSSERLNRDMDIYKDKVEKARNAGIISAEKRFGKKDVTDQDFAHMVKLYEKKTGKQVSTPREADLMKDIVANYSKEQFEKVLTKHPEKPLSYLSKVLENWKQEKEPKEPVRRSYSDGTDRMTEAKAE